MGELRSRRFHVLRLFCGLSVPGTLRSRPMKHPRLGPALSLSLALSTTACVPPPPPPASPPAARGYTGPLIDVHAHLRTGEDDGGKPDHPRGTRELRALEEQANA